MNRINFEEVCRYIGCDDQSVDAQTRKDIEEAVKVLSERAACKATYQIYHLTHHEDAVSLDQTVLKLTGKSIHKLLAESKQCILMAVTLGQQVDVLLRQVQIKDMSQAIIYDACASSMIECFCDDTEQALRKEISDSLHFTDRFSPGYGDLDLSVQQTLCNVLDTRRKIGLSVSGSGILIPRKSITAIIGLADQPQAMRIKGCRYCKLAKTCAYKKKGITCG